MHQRPTQPPDVNGWPRGTLWLSAQGMIERANFLRRCIVSRDLQSGVGISVADLLPAGRPTAEEVVDRLAWLLRVTLSPDERATCVTYLDTIRQADGQTVASPFDPTDNRHLEERVRGLLYILGQHPSYLIR
jgi:hypothetical protein